MGLYNDKTKRPKPQDTQSEVSKIYSFSGKFSRGPLVQERVLLELRINL